MSFICGQTMEQLMRNANVFEVTIYNAVKGVKKANSTCDCTCSIVPSVPGARKDSAFTGGVG